MASDRTNCPYNRVININTNININININPIRMGANDRYRSACTDHC